MPFKRALLRLLRPAGRACPAPGPTHWALYPSLAEAAAAAEVVRAAIAAGDAARPGPATAVRGGDPDPVRRRPAGRRRPREPRMTRQAISTGGAPAAIGPYSQAIDADGLVFCSGQLGLDPATGELVEGVEAQAERALRNLAAVLDAAGLGWADVAKTTIFLADIGDFATVNGVYAPVHAGPAARPVDGPGRRRCRRPPWSRSRRSRGGRPNDDGPDPWRSAHALMDRYASGAGEFEAAVADARATPSWTRHPIDGEWTRPRDLPPPVPTAR